MRGRKPKPTKQAVSVPGNALPRCPPHLDAVARKEWRRLAKPMHDAGVLTIADRAALAAYCQAYSRWVAAEEKLKETPMLLKTPSGYVQQSPWLSIVNKQMELMNRYMSDLGLTPVARTRLAHDATDKVEPVSVVRVVYYDPKPEDVSEPAPAEPDDEDGVEDAIVVRSTF
ncbi:phage terminase small subunit P27 family [Maritimibacter sp. 55A14]|uniref:phage terminase small subunit P27 family n=1 Tax=Maritimibacter sp. 55A14 TaxID=2174844 RepID=UPI000D61AB00|nr:phage terminase small subunit P27 family [Maritimibacter sp. 55A14]PWE30582.1 phage terminase small subunit P27 family [Maritimibacter sp. 55A14]